MSFEKAVHAKAIELSKLAVEMTTSAGSGHPSSALSLAHLVTILMYEHMHWDPKNPWSNTDDRLILSEGHAVPIVYAAYTDLGGMIGKGPEDARPMTYDDAMALRAIDSPIDGHPNPALGFPFFDAATGSLGQGLSVAAGVGLAAKLNGIDRNVYCLIGDGESREGQIYEALDFLVDNALTNVVPIFNCNALGQSDWVSPQQSPDVLARKLEAAGCIVRQIDGHNPIEIKKVLNEIHVVKNGNRPLAIVARTIKGWGSDSEQGMGKHGTPVKKDKMKAVLDELDKTREELIGNFVPTNGLPKITPSQQKRNATERTLQEGDLVSFEEAMHEMGFESTLQQKKPFATRKAYGVALCMLGKVDSRIMALDGDVKNSTFSEWFFKRFPDRAVECRIAEQNMVSVAAGLSAGGKIPFCSTFGKFFLRAYDQIEMAIISQANIKMTGSHAGVTLAADGPSQMALPDVAFFRSFAHTRNYDDKPAVRYFFPSDAVSCYHLTGLMAATPGCCYQRTLRSDLPVLYDLNDKDFRLGGFKVLREGSDFTIVSAGYMVHECLKVADEMSGSVTVIDAYTLPMDTDEILDIAARNGGKIVTVEDNYTGGLDAEIGTAIAESGADIEFRRIFVNQLPKSGREPADVLQYVGLALEDIRNQLA